MIWKYFYMVILFPFSITEVYMEDFYVEKGMLIKGLLPDCKLDVYYPGFPTMKHIPHTVSQGQMYITQDSYYETYSSYL